MLIYRGEAKDVEPDRIHKEDEQRPTRLWVDFQHLLPPRATFNGLCVVLDVCEGEKEGRAND